MSLRSARRPTVLEIRPCRKADPNPLLAPVIIVSERLPSLAAANPAIRTTCNTMMKLGRVHAIADPNAPAVALAVAFCLSGACTGHFSTCSEHPPPICCHTALLSSFRLSRCSMGSFYGLLFMSKSVVWFIAIGNIVVTCHGAGRHWDTIKPQADDKPDLFSPEISYLLTATKHDSLMLQREQARWSGNVIGANAFTDQSDLYGSDQSSRLAGASIDDSQLHVHHVLPTEDPFDRDFCKDPKYRKHTLKLIKDMPFIGLFHDLQDQMRFEASDVTFAGGFYWVVFDNLRSIGRVDLHFNFRGNNNSLIGDSTEESQFEGIAYVGSSDSFLLLRESIRHSKHRGLVPSIEEVVVSKDLTSYTVKEHCYVHFELDDENKGWEGMYFFERDGARYVLGLCESNHCATVHGEDAPGLERGHGRVVVVQYFKDDTECYWNVTKIIHLPKQAYFLDYSGLAFFGPQGSRVGITSQEDAAVWVGEFNWQELEFVGKGKVYHLPRDEDCAKIFCNIEGIEFIDAHRLVLASDKSKKTQPHRCMAADQAIHILALPQ